MLQLVSLMVDGSYNTLFLERHVSRNFTTTNKLSSLTNNNLEDIKMCIFC